jgi:hypothetical protein
VTLDEAITVIRKRLEGHPVYGDPRIGQKADVEGCPAHEEGMDCCVDKDRAALLVLLEAVSKASPE